MNMSAEYLTAQVLDAYNRRYALNIAGQGSKAFLGRSNDAVIDVTDFTGIVSIILRSW